MTDITTALDKKIAEIESQLAALKAARAALAGGAKARTPAGGARRKRKFTAAQRAEISRRMRATWAARRKAKTQK
jgi:hypothetical protein